MSIIIILIQVALMVASNAHALEVEQGQEIFDSVFWSVLTLWALGLSFGMAVKLINRS